MNLTWALTLAAFIFILIKSLFALLGWYSRDDGSDVLYRGKLDAWFDKLEQMTLFDVAHGYFSRWVEKVRRLLQSFKRPQLAIIGVFFWINLTSFLLWFIADRGLNDAHGKFIIFFLVMASALIIGGIFFDILSSFITWWLVKRAVTSLTARNMMFHVFLDIALAVLAIGWVILVFSFSTGSIVEYLNIIPLSILSERLATISIEAGLFSGIASLEYEGGKVFSLRFPILIMGASAALPTLAYFVFLIFLLLFKLTPQWAHKIVSKTIYLITTDTKPVLTQLGNVSGTIGALLAALLTVLKG